MCTHYWVIDSRNQGVCKLCGGIKDFQAALYKATKTNDKLTLFKKRIIEQFSVTGEYYLQGHIDKGNSCGVEYG